MLQLPRLRDHRQELSQEKPLGMNPLPNIWTMNRSKGIYLTWSIIRFQYNIQPTAFLNMAKDPWSYLALFHLPRIFFHLFCCVCIHRIPHPSRSERGCCSMGSHWDKTGLNPRLAGAEFGINCIYLLKKGLLTPAQNLEIQGKFWVTPINQGLKESWNLLGSFPSNPSLFPAHWDIWGKETPVFSKLYKSEHVTDRKSVV